LAQETTGQVFKGIQAGTGTGGSTKLEDKRRIEPMLVRRRRHLHDIDVSSFHTFDLVQSAGMVSLEFGDYQCLADVRVALQDHAWYPLTRWCLQEKLQLLKRLVGRPIVDPSVTTQ
jgi:hypothetical protein